MEKLFKLKEHGTNIRTEIIAGITTFLTMAYIIFLNPQVISKSNEALANVPGAMEHSAVFTATCIAAAIGTWLIGWLSNYPMAQAPGLGLNAVFTYTLCLGFKLSAAAALGAVFIAGVFFILLTVTGARRAIVEAIPLSLKKAITAGIGLFIAMIGFVNAGIVVDKTKGATTVDLGNFADPKVLLALAGILIITILLVRNVKAGIFIGMIVTAVIGNIMQFVFGMNMGITVPKNWVPHLDFSMFGKCFTGMGELFSAPIASLLAVLITLVLVDMFDTIGTLIGAADKAGYLDENGNLPKIERAMLADAIATSAGAVFGTSTVTTYVESTSGIAAGGRTGLTSTVTGICFALALFISPVVGFVPTAATAPVLIIVGILMAASLKDIKWDNLEYAVPGFFTVVGMPFFYSITDGIAFGFISYIVVMIAKGKAKKVHPLMYIIDALFILMYVITALQTLKVL
ncbi:MAG: NCS2 family permease [Ruminococcus sp.]|nr:NCS2 family permease [Ruminococcus sp.]